jgi:hypothetical protein
MKHVIIPALILLSATPIAQADDFLTGLLNSQTAAGSDSSGTSGAGTPTQVTNPDVGTVTSTASNSVNCPSSGQTTLPLRYVQGLLRTRGASLQLSQDFSNGRLHVRGGDMLANCNSMLEWGLRSPTGDFPQYVVELKVKACGAETCPFTVMEVNEQGQQVEKQIQVKPDLEGFKECLKQTGVVGSTGVVASKMVVRDLDVSFPNVTQTAPVWFGSHLPAANALYRKQAERGCYYMEDVRQNGFTAYSQQDSERARLDEQAQLICEGGNYRHIADFVERYDQYQQSLGSVRDELIDKSYKDLAEVVRRGENLETQDYSIIADFQRYILDPLTTRIAALHEEIGAMPQGQARRVKEEELRTLMQKLASYKSSPYLAEGDLAKLMAKGLFDEAASVNAIHLTAQAYGRIGATESGVLVTPRVARQRVQDGKQAFQRTLVERRREYEVRTGRVTGQSEYYLNLARSHRRNIETRTANYQAEIQAEVARITQPSGYCYRYFRNTQRCVQDSMTRIQELQTQMQRHNQSDSAIATELEQIANQYRTWEEDGRRYIASQNGEEAPQQQQVAEAPQTPTGPSTDAPTRAPDQAPEGGYQFQLPTQQPGALPGGQQYNPYAQQQPYNPYMQQPYNPYAQQQQFNPYGQQQQFNPYAMMSGQGGMSAFGAVNPYQYSMPGYNGSQMGYGMQQGGYTFNMGSAMGQQSYYNPQAQMGYGGNMWAGGSNPYQWGGGYQTQPSMMSPYMTQSSPFGYQMMPRF